MFNLMNLLCTNKVIELNRIVAGAEPWGGGGGTSG